MCLDTVYSFLHVNAYMSSIISCKESLCITMLPLLLCQNSFGCIYVHFFWVLYSSKLLFFDHSWSLQLYSTSWSQVISVFQLGPLSVWFWLYYTFASPYKFWNAVKICKIICWNFWLGLLWVCSSTWKELTRWQYWTFLSMNM